MKIYFDTEFSNLWDPQPISIGFAAEDGSTLYVEIERDEKRDGRFVREAIVPLLEGNPVDVHKARGNIRRYLQRMQATPPETELICDFIGDFWILRELLPDIVDYVTPRCARHADYTEALRQMGKPPHHALWDAMALRDSQPDLQVE